MNKLNRAVYNKLVLQAEEAKHLDIEKLAECVLGSVGAYPREEEVTYSYEELEDNVKQGLWKLAVEVLGYHDVESADIQKINVAVKDLTKKVIGELEASIGREGMVSSMEPKLLGEMRK